MEAKTKKWKKEKKLKGEGVPTYST